MPKFPELGRRVAILRARKGVQQHEAMEKIGVDPRVLSNLENGHSVRATSAATVQRWCDENEERPICPHCGEQT